MNAEADTPSSAAACDGMNLPAVGSPGAANLIVGIADLQVVAAWSPNRALKFGFAGSVRCVASLRLLDDNQRSVGRRRQSLRQAE